jgi:tRNA (guanine-N7-)-methyltransferase
MASSESRHLGRAARGGIDPPDRFLNSARPIRSYVRREGRLTPAQRNALERLWPRYVFDLTPEPLDFNRIFGRIAPVTLEIGFGNGAALVRLAENSPERDFIGIEVHRPGVGHLLRLLEGKGLTNVRVICEDAAVVLRDHIPVASLAEVLLWFPDPWPKKRHHKRRLVQPEFVRLLRDRLAPGGTLQMATDWEDYALHMLETVEADGGFTSTAGPGRFAPRPANRPLTKFEQRGQRLGHAVWDLMYRRH